MQYETNNELMHYGVLGMKWGKRKAKYQYHLDYSGIHAGPGKYLTRKRQLAGDKRDLDALNKGKHLRVGFTKKRQAAYDRKDREFLEKRIAKNEAHYAKKEQKKKIRNVYEVIQKNTKLGEKLLYNNATRKRAAKLVVKNKMTVAEAKKKANREAIRNTAIIVAAIGGLKATKVI